MIIIEQLQEYLEKQKEISLKLHDGGGLVAFTLTQKKLTELLQDIKTSDSSVEQDDEEIWQEVIDSVLAWGDIQPCRNSLKSRYEIKTK